MKLHSQSARGGFQKRSSNITYTTLLTLELESKWSPSFKQRQGALEAAEDDPYHFMAQPATVFSCFLCIRKPSHDMTDWNAMMPVVLLCTTTSYWSKAKDIIKHCGVHGIQILGLWPYHIAQRDMTRGLHPLFANLRFRKRVDVMLSFIKMH